MVREYTRGVRVLLAPHGTRGDVQPMLALASALRTRGHGVTLLVPDNFVGWVRAYGFDAHGNGIDLEQLVRSAGARLDSMRWQLRHLADTLIPRLFDSFASAPEADLIVGAGVQVAGGSVAEARRVPYATIGFCPCIIPSGAAPPPVIRAQSLPSWVNRAIWTAGRPFVEAALGWLLRGPRRALGLRLDPSPIETMIGDRLIIAADPDLAPLPDNAPDRIMASDAWVFDGGGILDPAVEQFLLSEPPPVYIGFGSMVAAHAADLGRQAVEATLALGYRALVVGGWAELDRSVPRDPDVLARSSVPHAAVLPRVAAVVHHGGAGTTTAAARSGRPQVLVPHILDQYYWAHRVAAMGLGPPGVPVSIVTADVLAERIDRAVHDPRILARASVLGSTIRGRNGVDHGVELLEALVDCSA